MKPLFKNIFLRIEKPKKIEEDLFNDPVETAPVSEATLVGFAHDCDDIVHTLMDKKVRWNGKWIDLMEETEEYKIVLAPEDSLTAML